MDTKEYQRMLLRYKSPFLNAQVPSDVLGDLQILLDQVTAQNRLIHGLRGESRGAMLTLMAIAKSLGIGGVLEIPHVLVALIEEGDGLKMEDVETPHGKMKRISYQPFLADPEDATERSKLIH